MNTKVWHHESRSKIRALPLVLRLKFTVNAPVKEFYTWFSDFDNYKRLFDHIISITPVDDGLGFEPGKQYIERAVNFRGKEEELPVRIISVEPEKSIFVKVDNPRVLGYFEFCFIDMGKDKTLFAICHYTGQKKWYKVKILKWGLALLFLSRKRKADKRLAEIFKK